MTVRDYELGPCLFAEFRDRGPDIVFPGILRVLGGIVDGQRGDILAQLPQQGFCPFQVVPPDVRLAVAPGVAVGCFGVHGGLLGVSESAPEFG